MTEVSTRETFQSSCRHAGFRKALLLWILTLVLLVLTFSLLLRKGDQISASYVWPCLILFSHFSYSCCKSVVEVSALLVLSTITVSAVCDCFWITIAYTSWSCKCVIYFHISLFTWHMHPSHNISHIHHFQCAFNHTIVTESLLHVLCRHWRMSCIAERLRKHPLVNHCFPPSISDLTQCSVDYLVFIDFFVVAQFVGEKMNRCWFALPVLSLPSSPHAKPHLLYPSWASFHQDLPSPRPSRKGEHSRRDCKIYW
jgi:hypothetical protein